MKYLSEKKKIEIYAFVIMPNHVHFIWQVVEMNGKEMSHGSFLKFTAHAFKKHLKLHAPKRLTLFAVDAIIVIKNMSSGKRDSLDFELLKKETILQKIDYVHYNPTADEHWKLCNEPVDYKYSSAKFYESGIDEFKSLTHWMS